MISNQYKRTKNKPPQEEKSGKLQKNKNLQKYSKKLKKGIDKIE